MPHGKLCCSLTLESNTNPRSDNHRIIDITRPAGVLYVLNRGLDEERGRDLDVGKAVLRDYINATIGFEELAEAFDKSSKSLMRMFGPKGNPQASNLFAVISYLQEREGIQLEVKARRVA